MSYYDHLISTGILQLLDETVGRGGLPGGQGAHLPSISFAVGDDDIPQVLFRHRTFDRHVNQCATESVCNLYAFASLILDRSYALLRSDDIEGCCAIQISKEGQVRCHSTKLYRLAGVGVRLV